MDSVLIYKIDTKHIHKYLTLPTYFKQKLVVYF